jgi:hypothetical protein
MTTTSIAGSSAAARFARLISAPPRSRESQNSASRSPASVIALFCGGAS